ncbi:hypothetical protein ACC771_12300, partial [Rhizobium ruizarguesonis]
MKIIHTRNLIAAALASMLPLLVVPVSAQENLDRTVLPIAEPKPPFITELDARNAVPPVRFEVKAPAGAPNVL